MIEDAALGIYFIDRDLQSCEAGLAKRRITTTERNHRPDHQRVGGLRLGCRSGQTTSDEQG
jgi:hypothetical protein